MRVPMLVLPLLTLCATPGTSIPDPGGVKKVITTSWWPAGNEKFEEAVGIASRGQLFATGMMENTTDPTGAKFDTHQLRLELQDVSDIAVAANTSLSSLVDCLVNVPVGSAAGAHAAMDAALGGNDRSPAITIMETLGEMEMFNSSMSCTAYIPKSNEPSLGHDTTTNGPVSVKVISQPNNVMWVAATQVFSSSTHVSTHSNQLWETVSSALKKASGSRVNVSDIVDCTILLPVDADETIALQAVADARIATGAHGSMTAAQLTVVNVGLGKTMDGVEYETKIRCTAMVNGGASKILHKTKNATVTVVEAQGFAFVSGVAGVDSNGTDVYKTTKIALDMAGSNMKLTLNCVYWMKHQSEMNAYFEGWHQAYNVDAYPPPSRTEFVGTSPQFQCLDQRKACRVLSKCVAAMPERR